MAEKAVIGLDDTTLIASKTLAAIAAYIGDLDNLIQASIKQAMLNAKTDADLVQDSQTYHKEAINEANKEQTARKQRIADLKRQINSNKIEQTKLDTKLENARGKEQTLRENLQQAAQQLAQEQGTLDQLNKNHYLDLPDEEIKN